MSYSSSKSNDSYSSFSTTRKSRFQQNTSININLPAYEDKVVGIEELIRNLDLESYANLDEENQEKYLTQIDAFAMFNNLKEIDSQLGHVKLEIYILTEFLEQNNPRLLIGLKQRRSTMNASRKSLISLPASMAEGSVGSRSLLTRASTVSTLGSKRGLTNYRINLRTKADMAEKAALEIDKRVKQIQKEARQEMKEIRAEIEELRYRAEETDETCKNFVLHFFGDENDVIFLETENERKVIDKLKKFTNNWFKSARGIMAAMRLRISRLDDSCRQYRNELIVKTDLSKVLSAVDFNQLIIKRTQLLNDLDEQYVNMDGIKNKTGKSLMAMGEEKATMVMLEEKHKNVKKRTSEMVKSIAKLEYECKSVKASNKKEMKLLEQMLLKLERYQAPSVSSYIEHKDEIYGLEKEEKILRRKINIMNMKLSNLNKQCKIKKNATT